MPPTEVAKFHRTAHASALARLWFRSCLASFFWSIPKRNKNLIVCWSHLAFTAPDVSHASIAMNLRIQGGEWFAAVRAPLGHFCDLHQSTVSRIPSSNRFDGVNPNRSRCPSVATTRLG